MPSTKVLNRALEQRNPEPFGRYQLLGRIASGGMAEIYVARFGEVSGLQTLLAIKRILPVNATDETFVRLFQREARILLTLQHAGIARVFEVGRVGEHWFLAMELVQGETLAQVNRALRETGEPWDPNLVAYIGAEAAHALHYAHTVRDSGGRALEIIHRDVSPQNIMLGFDGSVKVIDFGVARWEAPSIESRTSTLRGKMQYISPEQARGDKLDHRSDIFALGAVLYELLDGGGLFGRSSTNETLEAVCETPAKPLVGVPEPLNRVILRALEKDPEQRHKTASGFAQALVRSLDENRTVGPEDVGALVSSLFPARLRRWRQIHEMARAGLGFEDVLMPAGGGESYAVDSTVFESVPGVGPPVVPAFSGFLDEEQAAVAPAGGHGLGRLPTGSELHAAPPLTDTATRGRRARRWFIYGAATAAALGAGLMVGPLTLDPPEEIAPKDVRLHTGVPIPPREPPPEWRNLPTFPRPPKPAHADPTPTPPKSTLAKKTPDKSGR